MVFIGSTLFALQQLSGINAIFYFSTTVFKSFGVPSDLANICVGLSNLFGIDCFIPSILLEYLESKVKHPLYRIFCTRVSSCNNVDG